MTQFKFNEDNILNDLKRYIEGTYSAHYVGKNNVQSLDLIFSSGHGEGFCIGSILKYSARFGRKRGKNKDDLLKAAHYAILSLYLLEEEEKEEMLKKSPRKNEE